MSKADRVICIAFCVMILLFLCGLFVGLLGSVCEDGLVKRMPQFFGGVGASGFFIFFPGRGLMICAGVIKSRKKLMTILLAIWIVWIVVFSAFLFIN